MQNIGERARRSPAEQEEVWDQGEDGNLKEDTKVQLGLCECPQSWKERKYHQGKNLVACRWAFGGNEIDGKKQSNLKEKERSENGGTENDPTGTQKLEMEVSTKITWEWILLRAFIQLILVREKGEYGVHVCGGWGEFSPMKWVCVPGVECFSSRIFISKAAFFVSYSTPTVLCQKWGNYIYLLEIRCFGIYWEAA